MRAIDPNVVVRLIVRDDPRQIASAESFIQGGAWVSLLALAEAVWVLATVYKLSSSDLATGQEMLLSHRDLVLQDPETVVAPLKRFRANPRSGFPIA